MTLTFNADKYKQLLCSYQPKIIRTEAENEKALAVVEKLMHRTNLTPEEKELFDLLVALIEKFEREYYSPGSGCTPNSMLLFLMEQREIKPTDLAKILGSQQAVEHIINGKGVITKAQAKTLSEFFQVEPSLFILFDE